MLDFFIEIRREILFFAIFLVGAAALFRRVKKYHPVLISDILEVVKKTFIPVTIAWVGTLGILCTLTFGVNKKLRPSVKLSLQYENASSGKNTDGTRFNENDIISDEVFNRTLSSGKYKLTLEDMKHLFTVGSSYDNAEISETNPKVATEYNITYTADILNYDVDSEELIKDVGEAAKDYLIEKHGGNTSVLLTDISGIDGLDYGDAGDKLTLEAEKIRRYMANFQWTEQTFSDEKEQTFASLTKKVDNYIDTEIAQYQSYVLENGLTKNKSQCQVLTDYKNRLLGVSKDKHQVVYDVNLDAVDKYDSSMTAVMLIPTDDKSGEFYMSRTKIGVDYFAENAETEAGEVSELSKKMKTNAYTAEKVADSTATTDTYNKADEMLTSLCETLTSLSESASEMFASYQTQKYGGYITVTEGETSFASLAAVKKNVLAASALIFSIVYCFAALKNVFPCKKKEKKNVH